MKNTGKRSADYRTLAESQKALPASLQIFRDGAELGLKTGRARLSPLPEGLTWKPPAVEVQRERAIPILRATRDFFKAGTSLLGALAEAGGARIESEYARRALRDVLGEWNLMAWAEHPRRTRHEVFRAIDRALTLCRPSSQRGGWNVSKIKAA